MIRRYHLGHVIAGGLVGAGLIILTGLVPPRQSPNPVRASDTPKQVSVQDGEGGSPKRGGTERWTTKTGGDVGAGAIDLSTPQTVTIQQMRSWPVPPNYSSLPKGDSGLRFAPQETTAYKLSATIIGAKLESDSDLHLIAADAAGNTVICEIPDPDVMAAGSPWKGLVAKARAAFQSKFPQIGPRITKCNVPATLTGIGFFDRIHGQAGVSPNGVELHPILWLTFGGQP